MKNIEFKVTNEFGEIFSEKLDGRKFTRFVDKEAKEKNIRKNHVINDWIKSNLDKYLSNGKELSNEWYDWISIFHDGLAVVEREDDGDYLCNFIDKQGKLLSNEWFMWVDDFKDGFAKVKRTNGEQAKIDKNGKIITTKTEMKEKIKSEINFDNYFTSLEYLYIGYYVHGMISVGELAKRLSLPTDVVKNIVAETKLKPRILKGDDFEVSQALKDFAQEVEKNRVAENK